MKTASKKGKGRRLQQWIRDQLRTLLPGLEKDDVESRGMGQGGTDVILSPAAQKMFNYAIEAKNQEQFKGIYNIYKQATNHDKGEPLVFIKMNRQKPLALVDAEHFLRLATKDFNEQKLGK